MSVNTALLGVLLVAASALCGVGIWALIESVKTARSVRQLSDDMDARLVPLLDKADVTVDAMNAELLRVDQILTQFEEVSDRVSSTTRTVQEVANAPSEIYNDLADRVRRAWKGRKQHTQAEGPTGDEVQVEQPEPADAPWPESNPAPGEVDAQNVTAD